MPSVALVECLTGRAPDDAAANRLLKTCNVIVGLPVSMARRAAHLRFDAGRGSAVDGVVAALAEDGGAVLTTDAPDLRALAAHADDVAVERL